MFSPGFGRLPVFALFVLPLLAFSWLVAQGGRRG
jgi:hypothetical protein